MDRASETALATALIRSIHTRCDSPTIAEDPYGERLVSAEDQALILERVLFTLTPEQQAEVRAMADRRCALDQALHDTPAYAGVVVRVRYTDDRIAAAIEKGVRQYVALGAGFDTFALRRPDLAAQCEIFEIDRSATLELKRERLRAAHLALPSSVHLLAADLENESLGDVLSRSSYVPRKLAFFTSLGLAPYLTFEANMRLLRAIAAAAALGTELVFDYIDASSFAADRATPEAKRMVAERAGTDEPFRSGFDPRRIAGDLAEAGLLLIEDLGPQETQARYLAGRSDGVQIRAPGHLVHARRSAELIGSTP